MVIEEKKNKTKLELQVKTKKMESTFLNLQTISYTKNMRLNWFTSKRSTTMLCTIINFTKKNP